MFISDLLQDLTNVASRSGFLNYNFPSIPELIPIGKQYCLSQLNDNSLAQENRGNINAYYFSVAAKSLCAGLVGAYHWHADFDHFPTLPQYLLDIVPENQVPSVMGFTPGDEKDNDFKELISDLYTIIMDKLQPYWSSNDARNYIFISMVAMYQVGVAMELNLLGFQ